jgi:hypothetical protein
MALSPRFVLDGLVTVAGAFLTVGAMSFSSSVAGWVAFGVSTGAALAAVTGMTIARKTGQRIGQAAIGLVALWSLVAALSFSGPALKWLVFADAIGLGVLALEDLTAHEASTGRSVHDLEVTGTFPARRDNPGRAA